MRLATRVIPTAASLVVAASSFALSFVALRDVAIRERAVPAGLAWLVPVVVDGGVMSASAVLWAASAAQRRRSRLALGVLTTLLVVSTVINTAHAGPSLLAKVIAALPPLVLLASLELVGEHHNGPPTAHPTSPRHTEPAAPPMAAPSEVGTRLTAVGAASDPGAAGEGADAAAENAHAGSMRPATGGVGVAPGRTEVPVRKRTARPVAPRRELRVRAEPGDAFEAGEAP